MSVRYRLFLWIGVLFLATLVFSGIWQARITDKSLVQASRDLKEKIFQLNDVKRESIQKYIRLAIASNLAEIQALLETIGSYKAFEKEFLPTDGNYNWSYAADLLLDNKWIDFVQNTSGDRVLSVLIPNPQMLQKIVRKNIDENFCFVSFEGAKEIFLGIRMQDLGQEEKISPINSVKGSESLGMREDPHMYLLFSKQALEAIEKNFTSNYPFQKDAYVNPAFFSYYGAGSAEEFADSFAEKLEKALTLQESWPEDISSPSSQGKQNNATYDEAPIELYLDTLLKRNRMIAMVLLLSSYYSIDMTGNSPLVETTPPAVAYFTDGSLEGISFFAKDVFKTDAYPIERSEEGIVLIPNLSENKVYIGQSAGLKLYGDAEGRQSSLCVAIDPDLYSKQLSVANHDISFLTSQKKVLSGYDKEGDPLTKSNLSAVDPLKIDQKRKGFESWNGQDFFFIQMTPFPHLDLHYVLCTPAKQAFAILDYVEAGTKHLINTISSRMRDVAIIALVLVLICLNFVSKKMTKPIIQLSRAAEKVSQGNLETPIISYRMGRFKDEIAVLCESFLKMVQGLKEKEQVRSVLNKVVSPQIANQILETPIHLGGEVKLMTMLFADIRGFTHLTENMHPQEVIEMLNSCMTKVAEEVDRFGGVIDKYVGDEVMVLFGIPEHKPTTIANAIQAAMQMHKKMQLWNEERKRNNLAPVELGIGIHTGNVVAGNMGAENRLNYTVLGSEVNLGSRLCSMAKAGETLVSATIVNDADVQGKIIFEKMEPVAIKGFSNAITVYKVIGMKK